MFDGIEETVNWFLGEGRNQQNSIIETWNNGSVTDLENKVGEAHIDGILEMFERVRSEKSESRDNIVIAELIEEGFAPQIASYMVYSVDEVDLAADLAYIKRNTSSANNMTEASKEAIQSICAGLVTDETTYDADDPVVERVRRIITIFVMNYVFTKVNASTYIEDRIRNDGDYTDDELDALLSPIWNHLEDLQGVYIYNFTKQNSTSLNNIEESVKSIKSEVQGINDKLKAIGEAIEGQPQPMRSYRTSSEYSGELSSGSNH